jgi:hypothetical protein
VFAILNKTSWDFASNDFDFAVPNFQDKNGLGPKKQNQDKSEYCKEQNLYHNFHNPYYIKKSKRLSIMCGVIPAQTYWMRGCLAIPEGE